MHASTVTSADIAAQSRERAAALKAAAAQDSTKMEVLLALDFHSSVTASVHALL